MPHSPDVQPAFEAWFSILRSALAGPMSLGHHPVTGRRSILHMGLLRAPFVTGQPSRVSEGQHNPAEGIKVCGGGKNLVLPIGYFPVLSPQLLEMLAGISCHCLASCCDNQKCPQKVLKSSRQERHLSFEPEMARLGTHSAWVEGSSSSLPPLTHRRGVGRV